MPITDRSTLRLNRLDLRRAEPADLDDITRLQARTFGDEYGQDDVVDMQLVPYSEALLARSEDEIVAVALLVRPGAPRYWFERVAPIGSNCFPIDLTRTNVSELDGLIVAPSARGHGLGTMLSMLMSFVSREHGAVYSVALQAPASRRIGVRIGAVPLGVDVKLGHHVEQLVIGRVSQICRASFDWLHPRIDAGRVELDAELRDLVHR